jgi:uncharacterized caspase-like protein
MPARLPGGGAVPGQRRRFLEAAIMVIGRLAPSAPSARSAPLLPFGYPRVAWHIAAVHRPARLSRRHALLGFAAAAAAPKPARAEGRRLALVIGNGAYPDANIQQPRDDAEALGTLLAKQGFRVLIAHNVTTRRMHVAISDFSLALAKGDTAVVYFSGYGVQLDGRNYLMPVAAEALNESGVRREAVDLLHMLDQLTPAERGGIAVLVDACRLSPFQRRLRVSGTGLAPVTPPPGVLVSFAANPGTTSFDGDGRSSFYSAALVEGLGQRDRPIQDTLDRVRERVLKATNGQQTTWYASALSGPLVLG